MRGYKSSLGDRLSWMAMWLVLGFNLWLALSGRSYYPWLTWGVVVFMAVGIFWRWSADRRRRRREEEWDELLSKYKRGDQNGQAR